MSNFNDEFNFPHKLLLTNTQVFRRCKAIAKNSSTNVKLSKTQLHQGGKSGEFLGRLLGLLIKTSLLLMKPVLKPLAQNVLILLGLTVAVSTTGAAI